LVAGLALLAVAGLADLLGRLFTDGLVGGMPASLQAGVPNEFVLDAALLLAGGETALGVTARFGTTAVAAGAAVRGRRRRGLGQQACQRNQHSSVAHPHDLRLLLLLARPWFSPSSGPGPSGRAANAQENPIDWGSLLCRGRAGG